MGDAADISAFRLASEAGDLNVVNSLLEALLVSPATGGNVGIYVASENGHLAVVDRMLQNPRVDPAAGHNRAIMWASYDGHLAVVNRLLQDPRVDPAAAANQAFRAANESGHLAVVMRLLECPRVLRTVCPLPLSGELQVDGVRLAALLRRDALMRRAHLAGAVLRRRRGAALQIGPGADSA